MQQSALLSAPTVYYGNWQTDGDSRLPMCCTYMLTCWRQGDRINRNLYGFGAFFDTQKEDLAHLRSISQGLDEIIESEMGQVKKVNLNWLKEKLKSIMKKLKQI